MRNSCKNDIYICIILYDGYCVLIFPDFANVVASVPFQTNLIGLSESRTDLIRHPTTTGLNNPVVQVNIANIILM